MRLLAFALVCALLAGCTQTAEPSGGVVPTDEEPVAPTPDFTDSTGAIAGVVVDDSLMPMAGSIVTLHTIMAAQRGEPGTEALTDTAGRFTFSRLLPDAYRVYVKHESGNATAFVEVVAGVATEVRLQLESTPGTQPYSSLFPYRGFYSCTYRASGASGTCNALFSFLGGSDRAHFYTNFTRGINTTVAEYTWRASGAFNSPEMKASLHLAGSGIALGAQATGTSPLALRWNNFTKANPEKHLLQNQLSLPDASTQRPVQFVFQQGFDLYLTVFYHAAPPAAYTALPDY